MKVKIITAVVGGCKSYMTTVGETVPLNNSKRYDMEANIHSDVGAKVLPVKLVKGKCK